MADCEWCDSGFAGRDGWHQVPAADCKRGPIERELREWNWIMHPPWRLSTAAERVVIHAGRDILDKIEYSWFVDVVHESLVSDVASAAIEAAAELRL